MSLSHRMSKTRTYKSWLKMKERCTKPNSAQWKWYGGRGITICERWLNSFENFLADMGERPPGKSLDRYPDSNGNYEPGNCRWATHLEQIHGQRRTIWVELNGERMPLVVACDRLGINADKVYRRVHSGKSFEQAIKPTVRDRPKELRESYVEMRRQGRKHSEIALALNISIGTCEHWSRAARMQSLL